MNLTHEPELRRAFPQLSVATLTVDAVDTIPDTTQAAAPFLAQAADRLRATPASEMPEIAAWRRAFSQMRLKPTQYRCAAEALLRRYSKEGSLPQIHPLVDLGNAVALAYAIPLALFDLDRVVGDLTVRRATGKERYLTFGGDIEQPEPGEVIYADDDNNAHARRWTNRQSALSAISPDTRSVLAVGEAMHDFGVVHVHQLVGSLRYTIPR